MHKWPRLAGALRILSTLPTVSVDELHRNWKNKYLATRSDGSKYVKYNLAGDSWPPNAVTTSEAIGYGMLISVLRGEKPEFDGLLKFYQSFINPEHGMMKWQILDNFTAPDGNRNSATDGDMDVAYALFKAEKKWGGGSYKQQALSICQSLLTHCIKSGESHMPMVGSWAGPSDKRVLSRSSDWMPAHFLLFKKEDSAHADKWQATFDKTVAAYERNRTQHPTGLLADFYVYDESAKVYNASTRFVLENNRDDPSNSHDKDYFTNASRIPWRLASFWKAHGEQAVRDAGLYPAMKALKQFFESEIVSTGEVCCTLCA
ncbi:Six-hairpin glycosidase [Coccomyxa subellipsoidea C-169]|uniref:Six-hairpin glycosidase n=1 Tax=Coccomyxa subellipsoidea (strain C-169) TaxID=574566 RepID=I0YTP4_COCSC|nr:Six-hairpin glycosidase [Coccomyxa subellipsoidea C-169]EIE21763.1 Six-hairpin glycosidase [Coccomyxa subellipsoidea C-169]|eukprot:XP_005646307.1 Six-hairpin glycosidase [Coccomyxa subellipsoidea C-169]